MQLELAEAIGPTRARYPEDLRRVRAALEAWFPKLLDVAPDRRAEALAAELCADPAPAPPALRGDADGVRLLTFHGAKGLEFRHLLLSGLNAGLVPLARAAFKPTELREERRLFYVALTRAKDTLELSYHRQPDRPDVAGEPSPFLAELTTVTPDLARPPASGERPFARGDVVEHRRYGSGEVLEAGARVRVRFAGGARTFLPRLAVACLSRADADTGAPTSGA